jgi:hypothetical protein
MQAALLLKTLGLRRHVRYSMPTLRQKPAKGWGNLDLGTTERLGQPPLHQPRFTFTFSPVVVTTASVGWQALVTQGLALEPEQWEWTSYRHHADGERSVVLANEERKAELKVWKIA